MSLFPAIYLYSCSTHPLYIGMLFHHCFLLLSFFLFYLTLIWYFFITFLTTCKTFSIKIWFVPAMGVADNFTQVVFHQPFVIQHVRTRLLICETWISWCSPFIFSSTWNQFVIFDVIVFTLAAFVLFRDLSHTNAWINHTIPCCRVTRLEWLVRIFLLPG